MIMEGGGYRQGGNGSRRGGGQRRDDGYGDQSAGGNEDGMSAENDRAAEAVKNMLHQDNIMDSKHLQEVGAELQKAGSKEKTGFIEKEREYLEQLEELQRRHLATCIRLMTLGIVVFAIQFIFACVSVVLFGCLFGDCENQLVCFIHYIKFF